MPTTSRARRIPAGVYTVRRLDQLRLLASPLRLRLLEAFAAGPCTTKQAAAALRVNPTRLYHHARALERAGLIRLTGTRQTRGTTERYYLAVARQLAVDPSILVPPAEGLRATVEATASVFDASRDELLAAVVRGEREPWPVALAPFGVRMPVHATTAELTQLRRELMRFFQRIKKRKGRKPGAARIATGSITLAFVPVELPPAAGRRGR
jgi:DNA-binding transcriptional ArsR family regulator